MAIVFIAAAFLKLRNPEAADASFKAVIGLNRPLRRLALWAVALLEVGAAASLLLAPSRIFVIPGLILLGAFSIHLLLLWRRDPNLGCACFGDFGVAGPVPGLVRNALLGALLILALTDAPSPINGWSLVPAAELAILVVLIPEALAVLSEMRTLAETR